MKAAFFPGYPGRAVMLAFLLLILLLPAGCDVTGTYPADLDYPARQDPLVVATPKGDQNFPIPPGKLNEWIKKIDGFEGGKTLDPAKVKEKDRQDLVKALLVRFGKPAEPTVKSLGEDKEKIDGQCAALGLGKNVLETGSKLYRRHCLQCHGVPGDGRGPTGPWLSPPPRDYRRGLFKFISTGNSGYKPSRSDLHRTLHNGLEGTSMPSFALLKEEELQQLISYVIHLSIRGQTEYDTLKNLLEGGSEDESVPDLVEKNLGTIVEKWAAANRNQIQPAKDPAYKDSKAALDEAVKRGYNLFIDPKGKAICLSCHVDYGRQAPYKYEEWWGTLAKPMNLTTGVYRGGRRPIDHFWRIKAGAGPVMPANSSLSDDEVWDVVAFLQALPYPAMLPTDLRDRIYGKKPTDLALDGKRPDETALAGN